MEPKKEISSHEIPWKGRLLALQKKNSIIPPKTLDSPIIKKTALPESAKKAIATARRVTSARPSVIANRPRKPQRVLYTPPRNPTRAVPKPVAKYEEVVLRAVKDEVTTPVPTPVIIPGDEAPKPAIINVEKAAEIVEKAGITTNTHDYDGKLHKIISESQKMLPIDEAFFENDMLDLKQYLRRCDQSLVWEKYFDLIVTDHIKRSRDNFDPSNGIDAAQVLDNIYMKIKTLLALTAMQLEDMSTGPCPQGRATRLLSVFLST